MRGWTSGSWTLNSAAAANPPWTRPKPSELSAGSVVRDGDDVDVSGARLGAVERGA
jgi:hypothetical protein